MRERPKTYDLEKRLLEYSARIVCFSEKLPSTRAGNHIGGQLLRSGTSALFNHGEAEVAESPKDFVHKLKICLKELSESKRALGLIMAVPLVENTDEFIELRSETLELIRIFSASIKTAKSRMVKEPSASYGVSPLDAGC